MSNKDGIISIGFDYKKELEKMIKEFEAEMTTVSNNTQLSKGMKKQFDMILEEMREFKSVLDKEIVNLGNNKVNQSTFKSFKQIVENKFISIREDIDRLDLAVTTLTESIGILDKGIDLNKISNDFKNFEEYVNRTNDAVENLIHTLGEQGISLFSFDSRNTSDIRNIIKKINEETSKLDKDVGINFESFNDKQAQEELNKLSSELVYTLELMENAKKQMENMDSSTDGFKKIRGEFAFLQLKAASLNDTIETLYEVTESKDIYIEMDDKSLLMYEKYTDELSDNLDSITTYAKNAKKELSSLLDIQKKPAIKVSSEIDPNSTEFSAIVTIDTTSSELWKKLSPIMRDLQGILNSNPVIAPVKLVVAPTAVSSEDTGNLKTSENYSKKYKKILSETNKDAVIDLEGVYKKTFTSIMNSATSYAKESIAKIQEIFDKNLINVKFDVNQEEIDKIQNFVLSNKDGKKVDISGQITKAKQEVEELNESIEKTAKLLDDTKSKGNVKFDGFDKFTQDVSKSIGKLEELQNILKALQNIEITLAKASGIASITELDNQWANVEKRILNATKLDGSFRKNASVSKIASEYQKYIDMGGTNSIADIDKIKDNKDTLDAIISKAKEFAKQDLSNDSVKELSIELDGIIGKFDELIATVKTATNALYKIIKQTGVSELDKQWSSITNKFKSIADESGKINLSKQKKDVEELLVMYQRYVNMGGSHTPFDLTDNLETVAKLDKAYKKLNETKPIDNSSTIKSETESFKQIEQSVDSLTKAIGDTKVQAINVEATAMEDAAEREILAIHSIYENLGLIIDRLNKIKNIKIPKLEIKNELSSTPVDSVETNISSENSIADSKKELSNIIDISSKFNKSLDTTDKKYEKIKNDILTVVDLYKKMLSVNDDFDKYNEAYSKTYDYVKKIGLEQNVYWNKIWQGVKTGVENDNYDDLINGIYSGSIRENNSITEFNKEVIKLDKILQALYGKSINYKEVFLDIFNKLRDGAYSYDKALNKIQEDMNNKPSDLFNDMLYNEGLYPSQLKDNKPSLTIVEGQNKIQEELDETVAKINNVGKAYDIMAYRGIEAEEAVAKASKNYNGATHWSSDEKIARGYGDIVTSGNISLKNAFEVDGNGAYWDKIQILGDGLEENSKKAIEFSTSIDKVYSELSTLLTLNSDFNKFNPGFALYSSIGEEISKLSEEQKSQDDSESKITSEKIQRLAKIRDLYADLVAEYDKFSRDTSHPYGLKTTDELTKYAQANGYDGAIYKNIIDAKHSPIISGNEYIETSNIIVSFYENQVEYLEKISRKGQEYIRENISNLNIDSPIKDTFQGDKIKQATTSAKELDKTLEQAVDVPTDKFDEILSKLDLTESKLGKIARITKQMHIDENGKPIESYTLKDKYGSTEIYGESSNKATKQLLSANYVEYDSKQAEKEAKELLAVEKEITKEIEKQEKAQASAQKKKWQAFENEQKKYVSDQKKTTDIEKNKSAYQELLDTIKQYSEVSKRIAKNETLDGDLELAQKLENKISELQKNPILSSSQIAKSERDLVNLFNQLDTLEKKTTKKQSDKSIAQSAKEQAEAWEKNVKAIQEYMDANTKLNNLKAQDKGTGKKSSEIVYQTKEVERLEKVALEARAALSSMINPHEVSTDDWKKWLDMMRQFDQATEGSAESLVKLEDTMRNMVSSKIESYQHKLNSYNDATKYTSDFVDRVNKLQSSLNDFNITNTEDISNLKNIEQEIDKIISDSKLLENKLVKQDSKIADIISKMKIYRDNNTNMTKSQKSDLQELINYAESLFKNGKVTAQAIEEIKVGFSGVKAQVSATKKEGLSFIDQVVQRTKDINTKFIAQFFSWQDWIRYAREGIQVIREFDTALTEMRKVSNETISSLRNFQNESFNLADSVGTSAKQIQNSTADYMRLGESLDEATESARVANILLNVSEFDNIDDATSSLVSMGQAYKDLDKIEIVDKLNEVGNSYAISTDELAVAMQKSAATLSLMGNSIDETASMITTANSVLQDADTVSAGLRTISLRIVGKHTMPKHIEIYGCYKYAS